MPMRLKLGQRPARKDYRVPRFSLHTSLPAPTLTSNWYAVVEDWGMLANDTVSDCFEAACLHMVYQMLSYVEPGAVSAPTVEEVLAFYSAATGYTPDDPSSDQGTYLLGPGGGMEYWHKNPIQMCGMLNSPAAYMQITKPHPMEWRQAISMFGHMLIGIDVPESLMAADVVPAVWRDCTGESAGGHAVLVVGYDAATVPMEPRYKVVSWGQLYDVTEAFLLARLTEAIVTVNPAFMNSLGVDPGGVAQQELLVAMTVLRDEAS